MAEEITVLPLPEPTREIVRLQPNTVKDDILMDLDDISRLTLTPGLNPIIKSTINKIAITFQMRVAYLLSPIRPGRDKPLPTEILGIEALDDISMADLDNLEEISGTEYLIRAQKKIRSWVEATLNDPRYQKAAINYKDQDASPTNRADLYHFLSSVGFLEHADLEPGQTLYHGIGMGEFGDELCDAPSPQVDYILSPEAYARKIKAIKKEGLKAAPAPENLPLLDSIFCVEDIRHAYGIAVMSFLKPAEEKLWGRGSLGGAQGMQLVKPCHRGPFKLALRSPSFYDALDGVPTRDIFSTIPRKRYADFLKELKPKLNAANLPFQMIEPDGSTSRAK